jgi:hypothetical protein
MNAFPEIAMVYPPKQPTRIEKRGEYTLKFAILPDGREYWYGTIRDYTVEVLKGEV